ncbi:MAG: RNA polymerase sigma factor [Candidatus Moranbacteria bacterium]|nr:RNA polymerase sigma factor [Candidatus Moranbacteria bacterium]OIQ03953.1 MAG: hypothetical protein AUK58_01360 [Candidatus Moranbacteria bacterium CG2_30_41_165]PIP25533.1 MAG: hypothetical protein COX32_02995 [Candidatus Moranbacteria bacterium CG23_combo_of_CG06-09_8_20_14_all_41_28]PIV85938.1 MAG: hypothetical protein COW50_04185 [Candidatus Moranbacteria bacterium CG17_big_fil_post_rev_8_21_14_2_50_41_107]PIW94265.1 MAG: hypothetical protein COZ86_01960 [Candidatus Moranbacteria bacter
MSSFDGSEESLERLVEEYTTPLYYFVFQFVHDRQTAEDIVQDTWIKVWKHKASFDRQRSVKTWIFTIAKNTTFDFLKKKKTLPFSSLQDEEDGYIFDASDEHMLLPDEIFEREESRENIFSAIERLPDLYRALLFLAYHDDFSLGEIASLLGVPYNTIKSRHQRAIKMLREALLSQSASEEESKS